METEIEYKMGTHRSCLVILISKIININLRVGFLVFLYVPYASLSRRVDRRVRVVARVAKIMIHNVLPEYNSTQLKLGQVSLNTLTITADDNDV